MIGDSFTDGMGLPSSEMYYAKLNARYPDKHLVSYGGKGYGTLQELMLVKRILKEEELHSSRPELIVVQVCTNDILNNSYELELYSVSQRPPAKRPYYEDGKIQLRYPRKGGELLYKLISNSRILGSFLMKIDLIVFNEAKKGHFHAIEQDILHEGLKLPAFKKAVDVTAKLFRQMKEEAGDTKLIFLLINPVKPEAPILREMLKGDNFVDGGVILLGMSNVHLEDGAHLNAKGNAIVGEELVRVVSGVVN